MIARIVIPLLLVIVLSDVYIDAHYFRKRVHITWQQRLAWWIPTIFLVTYTCILASIHNFAPTNLTWLNTYLFLLGAFVGPKTIFGICSIIGSIIRKTIIRTRRNYGHYVGLAAGIAAFVLYVYGLTFGFSQIRVRHITLTASGLPRNFDGYRIVQVSDMHIGTFNGWRRFILENEMDSIKQANADLIVFTGDLQNMRPSEILPFTNLLKTSMKNAIAVRGNHDYTEYVKLSPKDALQIRLEAVGKQPHNHQTRHRQHRCCRHRERRQTALPTESQLPKDAQGSPKRGFRHHASARPISMETPHSAREDGADNAERAYPRRTNADFWLPSDQNSGEKRLWRVSQRQPDT